jgi:hypothetical protein
MSLYLAQLKSQSQPKESILILLKEVKTARATVVSLLEKNFFKALEIFLQNHLELVTALAEGAILLPKEEEAHILKAIAENEANPTKRTRGWENVAKLFA